MGRTRTIVNVPISETRCWSCSLLEKTVVEKASSLIERFRCPRNMVLPERLPPYFAEKCNLYKPKRKWKQ
jgi:hypothetical protein